MLLGSIMKYWKNKSRYSKAEKLSQKTEKLYYFKCDDTLVIGYYSMFNIQLSKMKIIERCRLRNSNLLKIDNPVPLLSSQFENLQHFALKSVQFNAIGACNSFNFKTTLTKR